MATITTLNGKRYFTYSNEHAPAHVHVSTTKGKAKFELNCPRGPIECVTAQRGLSDPELNAINKEISSMLGMCCKHWKDNHGDYIQPLR